ncbi:MAG: DUF2851 family protein [Candidatus Amulumruptor caecigallinarius]|nr:DUF2851 family protein [Candidatus Amulumruptor caecigallinarius]
MEMLYQYIWKYQILNREFVTTDGRRVKVIYPGRHNLDSGPDFLEAKLMIGEELWVGNVEVHVKASDWYNHKHDSDIAYNGVIMHVVGIGDRVVADASGRIIPQLILTFPESFIKLYAQLADKISANPCEPYLKELSGLDVVSWMSSLGVERMQNKARRIIELCNNLGGDWQQACFVTLARALGFGLNSEPLELLARSLPLKIIYHHIDYRMQLEALLFGQACMLDSSFNIFDEYYQSLCREYVFLARKYQLKPMRREMWKYARTRPGNFPHRRIALLASMLCDDTLFIDKVIDNCRDINALRNLFRWQATGYWTTHFDFGKESASLPLHLSEQSVNLLLINFAAPMIYAYGATHGDADMEALAMDIWESVPAEQNRITRRWKLAGLPLDNAFSSQSLIELSREYCERRQCLNCRFGHALLRKSACLHKYL